MGTSILVDEFRTTPCQEKKRHAHMSLPVFVSLEHSIPTKLIIYRSQLANRWPEFLALGQAFLGVGRGGQAWKGTKK